MDKENLPCVKLNTVVEASVNSFVTIHNSPFPSTLFGEPSWLTKRNVHRANNCVGAEKSALFCMDVGAMQKITGQKWHTIHTVDSA
jgi:hypothetical protein